MKIPFIATILLFGLLLGAFGEGGSGTDRRNAQFFEKFYPVYFQFQLDRALLQKQDLKERPWNTQDWGLLEDEQQPVTLRVQSGIDWEDESVQISLVFSTSYRTTVDASGVSEIVISIKNKTPKALGIDLSSVLLIRGDTIVSLDSKSVSAPHYIPSGVTLREVRTFRDKVEELTGFAGSREIGKSDRLSVGAVRVFRLFLPLEINGIPAFYDLPIRSTPLRTIQELR